MAKLPRIKQEIFGSEAGPQDIGVVGSLHEGNPTYALTTEQIQSLEAFKRGLRSVVIGENSPILEEDNGMYKLITQQLAYLLQTGVPEWNEDTVYYRGSWVTGPNAVLYFCTNDNTMTPPSDTVNWMAFNIDPEQWPDRYIPMNKLKSDQIAYGLVDDSLANIGNALHDLSGSEVTMGNKPLSNRLCITPKSFSGELAGIAVKLSSILTNDVITSLVILKKVGDLPYEVFESIPISINWSSQNGKTVLCQSNIEVIDDFIHEEDIVKYKLAITSSSLGTAIPLEVASVGVLFSVRHI